MSAPLSPDAIEAMRRGTALETLGIDIVEATATRVVLTLDVGPTVHQPYGFLHGGVSALLAESCASIGAWLAAGDGAEAFGVEINANHLRPVRSGRVTAVATPIRQGRTIGVWDTTITDEQERLVCVSRCTVAIRAAGTVGD